MKPTEPPAFATLAEALAACTEATARHAAAVKAEATARAAYQRAMRTYADARAELTAAQLYQAGAMAAAQHHQANPPLFTQPEET